MKLNVANVVGNMTQGYCIPIDSLKSGDDCSNFVHNTEIGEYVELDKTNPVYLVDSSYVMLSW